MGGATPCYSTPYRGNAGASYVVSLGTLRNRIHAIALCPPPPRTGGQAAHLVPVEDTLLNIVTYQSFGTY